MSKIASSSITLIDVMDGEQPITMFMSNANHTLVADANGYIQDVEKSVFESLSTVFIGETEAVYSETDISGDPANNKYKYNLEVTSAKDGWTCTTEIDGNKGKITLDTVPTGTTNKSATIDVVVTVVNEKGNIQTGNMIISLSKGIQGVDGVAIRLEANKQYFVADGNNALIPNQNDVSIEIKAIGEIGTLTAYKRINGGSEVEITDVVFADDDDDGVNDTNIVISSAEFDSADTYTVIVRGTGGATVSDSISIARVKQGIKGESAISVVISSDTNGNVFKNGNLDTHTKKISARVYDMETGNEITTGVTYLWKLNGENAKVDTDENITPSGEDDATESYVNVESSDVPDGGAIDLTCEVSVG